MKFSRRSPRITRFSVLLLITLGTLALFAGEAAAFLHRVGPINPAPSVGNFPAWYQDNTGITLEFCDPSNAAEVAGAWCLLGAVEVPTPPEVFPTEFFDEHFWYAADAIPVSTNPVIKKAILVLAVEAAFGAGVAPGGQIAFSRIRIRLEDVPVTGTYRFIHPYGEENVEAAAGDRIFVTDDFGIACAPGDFSCALNSRLGPFLLPSATPGGAEMPPLTAANPTPDTNPAHFGGTFTPTAYPGNGKSYIADPSRDGPVTGSPTGNNFFRIEGPAGSDLDGAGNDFLQTNNFTLMGRIFTGNIPGEVTVERAEYARNGAGEKVEVYATGLETTQGRIPGQAPAAAVFPVLSFFDNTCTPSGIDNNLNPIPPYSAPAPGAIETQMPRAGNNYWAMLPVNGIPAAVCVKDSVSNAFFPKTVVDEITILEAYFDPNAQSLSVKALSSDEITPPVLSLGALGNLTNGLILVPNLAAPPSHVHVASSHGGANLLQVTTSGAIPAATGVTLQATPGSPQLVGTQVAFIAAGQGGTGIYEYQFSDNVTGTMTVKQPYSTASARTWNTTGVPNGSYAQKVDVRSLGSTSSSEASNSTTYVLATSGPATGVLVTPDQPSPQYVGNAVLFFANGLGSSGYQYRFWLHDGASWSMVQDYGVGSTWSLPASTPIGSYTLAVDVRTSPAVGRDTVTYLPYQVTSTPAPATGVDLIPNQTSPHLVGTAVLFAASGIGSSGYQYRFWLFDGATWSMVQDYGVSNAWILPASTPAGSYTLAVDVRTTAAVVRDAVTYLPYQITP